MYVLLTTLLFSTWREVTPRLEKGVAFRIHTVLLAKTGNFLVLKYGLGLFIPFEIVTTKKVERLWLLKTPIHTLEELFLLFICQFRHWKNLSKLSFSATSMN